MYLRENRDLESGSALASSNGAEDQAVSEWLMDTVQSHRARFNRSVHIDLRSVVRTCISGKQMS